MRLLGYRRERPQGARGGLGIHRNLALYQDKVLLGTSDAHLVALDAESGRVVWDVVVADASQGYSYTAGPIAGDGRVFAEPHVRRRHGALFRECARCRQRQGTVAARDRRRTG